MNVLSLFDGMSCGRIALERAGIEVDNYYSSEIDKYAIQVADKNYPQDTSKRLGSVIDLDEEYLKSLDIDMLIGGSPCQGFSISGKLKGSSTKCGKDVISLEQYLQLKEEGFEFDGQSYLFWEYVRIWKVIKPKYFFLENVRVTKKWLPMFNEAMGVEPIMINSALVSAQNRIRFYWTNIPNVTQPDDKGILLKDILDYSVEDTHIKPSVNKNILDQKDEIKAGKNGFHQLRCDSGFQDNKVGVTKSPTLRAGNSCTYTQIRPCEPREFKSGSTCHHAATATDIKGNESIKRVYADTGKSPTLTTMQEGHREPKVLCVPEATKKGYIEIQDGDCFDATFITSKTRRGRNMKDKCNCLTAANYDYMRYEHPTYRKLTPMECERLQTVPDGYTNCVSNSQRYKMLGNGWTIDVIAHIFKGLKNENK